ncbi:MAG: hypothetical protein GJ680_07435 [Alteromonadaceae bacterium]|nr:hypothetical protein [Alteromonadaceae bacterium]
MGVNIPIKQSPPTPSKSAPSEHQEAPASAVNWMQVQINIAVMVILTCGVIWWVKTQLQPLHNGLEQTPRVTVVDNAELLSYAESQGLTPAQQLVYADTYIKVLTHQGYFVIDASSLLGAPKGGKFAMVAPPSLYVRAQELGIPHGQNELDNAQRLIDQKKQSFTDALNNKFD